MTQHREPSILPPVIRPSETVSVVVPGFQDDTISLTLYVAGETVNLGQRADNNDWETTWFTPVTLPLGRHVWQVWRLDFTAASSMELTGEIQVLPSVAVKPQQKSGAEVRLEQVDKAIDRLVKSGVQSYTLAGNTTTRMSIEQLRRERQFIVQEVNRERQTAGLPLIDGTQPAFQPRAANL